MHLHVSFIYMFAAKIISIMANEEELPLCPTEVNYLPQSLPMHCRMPRHADYPMYPGTLPNLTFPPLPPGFQSLAPDKLPQQALPAPAPGAALGAPPRGAPMPMPMPMHVPMMPMPMSAPTAHKLPVIVMPFYSPDGASKRDPDDTGRHTQRKKKKRIHRKKKPRRHSHTESGTDTSDEEDWSAGTHESSSADSEAGWWRGRRSGGRADGRAGGRAQGGAGERRSHRNKKALLHPILQYVTDDGYVIYEKKISKNQANDWLQNRREENVRDYNEPPKEESRDKEEENEGARGAQAGEGSHTAIIGGDSKTKTKSYKNPHRRKSKKASKDNDEG